MNRKKTYPAGKPRQKTPYPATVTAKTKASPPGISLFEKSEKFMERHLGHFFWIVFALTLITGILLFDRRFSTGGDDSAYVERAWDMIHHSMYPGFQGPLYPIVLSPFVALFGIRAIPLKCLSLLFILGFIFFFFRSFRNRIPALLLISVLLLISANSFVLYYGSQTYSEAFFMFLQALTFSIFFRFFVDKKEPYAPVVLGKHHLILACCLVCLGLTRQIGFSAAITTGVYFVVKKQWKNLGFMLGSFLMILLVYQAFLWGISGRPGIHFAGEIRGLISKDYYNPAAGHETIGGFINRWVKNSNYYLSKSFYTILGFRPADGSGELFPWVTVITWLLIAAGTIMFFRSNDYIFFTGIYTIITLFSIFFIAHTIWMQNRFIVPYFPLILLTILSFFYYSMSKKQGIRFRVLLPVIIVIPLLFTILVTAGQVREARKITGEFQGLGSDWDNYCRLSEWTAKNLPENSVIACRKPSISFIYSRGRDFYGISRLPYAPVDSLIREWNRQNRHYWLVAASALNKPVSEKLYYDFKKGIAGIGMNVQNKYYEAQFYLLDFPDSTREMTLKEMGDFNIGFTDRIDSLKAWLKNPGTDISMIYPDSLLRMLASAHVTHVLTDNIQFITGQQGITVIPTLERYMKFIETKYPGIRTKIMQEGSNDDNPAVLYRINYEQAGM